MTASFWETRGERVLAAELDAFCTVQQSAFIHKTAALLLPLVVNHFYRHLGVQSHAVRFRNRGSPVCDAVRGGPAAGLVVTLEHNSRSINVPVEWYHTYASFNRKQ